MTAARPNNQGGNMRGEKSVAVFAREMLATLNMPKNAAKGDNWAGLDLVTLDRLLAQEFLEVLTEIDRIEAGDKSAAAALMLECADLANVAMMLRDHAEKILITSSHNVKSKGPKCLNN